MTTERTMVVPARALKAGAADCPVGSASDQVATRCFEVVFLPSDCRVGQMRRITLAHLHLWDLTGMRDRATLAVSELVSNAVRHGHGKPVGLRVMSSVDELRIEVTDGNPTPARLREADDDAENGRGLLLIAALAKEWGVSHDGRMTWCSLAIPAGRS